MRRWETTCLGSASRSVAELDARLRSLLDSFLALIPQSAAFLWEQLCPEPTGFGIPAALC